MFFCQLSIVSLCKTFKIKLLDCYWWILMIVISHWWIVPLMSVRDVAICFELGSWLEVTIHICQQVLVSDLINSYLLPIKLHLTVRTQRRVRTNSRNCLSVRDVFFSSCPKSAWRFPFDPSVQFESIWWCNNENIMLGAINNPFLINFSVIVPVL